MAKNKRDTQRERWARHGLIARKQEHRPGLSGSVTEEGIDTVFREHVIRELLDSHYTYQHVAGELILQGYPLYKGGPARQFLQSYCASTAQISNPHVLDQRKPRQVAISDMVGDSTNATKLRHRIRRKITDMGDASNLSLPVRDAIFVQVCGMSGILPNSLHQGLLDSTIFPPAGMHEAMRAALDVPACYPDTIILRGLAQARTIANQFAPLFSSMFRSMVPEITSDDELVRASMPWHRCSYQHTVAQSWIPELTLLAIFNPEEFGCLPQTLSDMKSLLSHINYSIEDSSGEGEPFAFLDVVNDMFAQVREREISN